MASKVLLPIFLLTLITTSGLLLSHASVRAQQTTLTVGWGAAVMDTINPTAVTVADGGAYVWMHSIYDTLVEGDANGNPIPGLAYTWTYTNATTLVLNLVQNATWHDGQPFTAADVVFTVNLFIAHPEFTLMNTYVTGIKSVSNPDNYTVDIQLTSPDSSFIDYKLMGMYILPKHIWQSISNYTTFANSSPVGTGPFMFAQYGGPNTYLALTANPNYFYVSRRPKVDNVNLEYFTSYNAMALALESGKIDYAGPLIPPALIPQLTSAPGVEIITKPDVRYNHLYFNVYPNGTANPAMRDVRVRRALAHAVNNTYLAIAALEGYARPVNVNMPASLPFWTNPNISAYDFNLTEAAAMLDAAGYKMGSNGVRVGPTGVPLSITIETPSDYTYLFRAAQIVSGWWGQIGVQATPELLDVGTLAGYDADWKFDAQMWAWSAGATIDPDWFLSTLLSSQAGPAPNPGLSDAGFMNATYDALYNQQVALTNVTQRQQIVFQMEEIVHQQVPYIPLFTPLAIQAFRSDMFTGLPVGTLPPEGQFYTNNLLVSLTPIMPPSAATVTTVMTTSAPSSATSNTGIIAVIALIIVVIAALALLLRKRSPPKETK